MATRLTNAQKVGLAIVVSSGNEKPRRSRRIWAKQLYLERPKFSHIRILEVLDSDDFRNFMRMTPEVFHELLSMVKPYISKRNTTMREAVTAEERLIITLRYLATGRSFKDLQFSAAVSPSLMSSVIRETCDAIYVCLKNGIKMPSTAQQWLEVAEGFEAKWNFPHCLGAIDGKHISINKPAGRGSLYYNYKKFFSVIMLALVDANYQFLYVNTGTNGSVSDSSVLERCKFHKMLMSGTLNLPEDGPLPGSDLNAPYVFIGDSIFSINRHTLKPFGLKNINHERRIFNYRLSRARRVVENAFGILASRFRIFRQPIAIHLDAVDKVVMACCALHNYLSVKNNSYLNDGVTVDCEDITNSSFRPGEWRHNTLTPLCQRNPKQRNEEGNAVRDSYVQYFNNEGSVPFQEEMAVIVPHH